MTQISLDGSNSMPSPLAPGITTFLHWSQFKRTPATVQTFTASNYIIDLIKREKSDSFVDRLCRATKENELIFYSRPDLLRIQGIPGGNC